MFTVLGDKCGCRLRLVPGRTRGVSESNSLKVIVLTDDDLNGLNDCESQGQSNPELGIARPRNEFGLPALSDPMMALSWYRQTNKRLFAFAAIGGFLERGEPLDDDLKACLLRLSRVIIGAVSKRQTMESCRQVVTEALFGSHITEPEEDIGQLQEADWNRMMKAEFSRCFEFLRDQAIVAAMDDLELRRGAIKAIPQTSIQTKDHMFESVAKEYGVNKEDVKRIYYRERVKEEIFSIE